MKVPVGIEILEYLFQCGHFEFLQKYERGYQHLQNLISGLSDKEMIDALTSAVNREKSQEEMICLGMITVILTEPHNAEKVEIFTLKYLLIIAR